MSNPLFEELDYRPSPIGALSLRRRRRSAAAEDIYEIKLDEGYLMSSLFTEGEVALAEAGLAPLGRGPLDVVIGGLGLGYTAKAALDREGVAEALVIEAIPEVIEWHARRLVPLGDALAGDPRCRLVEGDFFALAAGPEGFDPDRPGRRFDAILLDIDHSPRHLLHPDNAALYEADGLRRLADKLKPSGVFALWSTDAPDAPFLRTLREVFSAAEAKLVTFDNPYQETAAHNTIYVASAPG